MGASRGSFGDRLSKALGIDFSRSDLSKMKLREAIDWKWKNTETRIGSIAGESDL